MPGPRLPLWGVPGIVAAVWLGGTLGGLAGATLFVAATGGIIVLLGVGASVVLERVTDPYARGRPGRDPTRCHGCRGRRLDVGGLWLCPRCDRPGAVPAEEPFWGGTAGR